MSERAGPVRRAAVFLIPAALVALGWSARAFAGRAFEAFTFYPTPYSSLARAPQAPGPPLTPRVVLVLLDGLGLQPSRSLPFLNELRGRGASFDCRIGQPSLSLPGRAVLMSGAWQEVNGQTTNYHPHPLEVEHIFALAAGAGRATALAAGAKAQLLFTPHVGRQAVYPEDLESAPFAHYEQTLRADTAAADALLQATPSGFVFLDLDLVDEAGHGWGAASPEYAQAALEVDAGVRRLASHLDLARDTLVVTADHGHVAAGGHGGPEPEVMDVPLVLVGRAVRPGVSGAAAQVDVAPTLAVLLGLPQPAAAQGRPLLEALVLSDGDRMRALGNAVLQRRAFVQDYARTLERLPLGAFESIPRFRWRGDEPPILAEPVGGDPAVLEGELQTLRGQEAQVKAGRAERERGARLGRALTLAAAPLVLLGLLGALRVFGWDEAAGAAGAALAAVLAYHLLLPLLGLRYSLTAVNKDEWLQPFFMKDMVAAVACAALAALALCVVARRGGRGATLVDGLRLAWLCAAFFCTVLLLEVAFIYARFEVFPTWALPDQAWGMAFYMHTLGVMAVGLTAPVFALAALAARAVPGPAPLVRGRPAGRRP